MTMLLSILLIRAFFPNPFVPVVATDTIPASDPASAEDISKKIDIFFLGNETPQPTLVSLTATLLSFRHPFSNTKFANKPGLGKMTDKEGIDKARSHILEGLHWINEVSLRSRARASSLAAKIK